MTGRVFAPMMDVGGHAWLDRPEREREESTTTAVQALGIRPGMVIADIGAGSGYYTVRLAQRVGPTGRVFATDIQRGMLDLIDSRVRQERLSNVTTVLGSAEDPSVPIQPAHKMSVDEARRELSADGFIFDRAIEDLPWQHILVFKIRRNIEWSVH